MWREMTENDLLQRISSTELDTMREVLLGDDQPDPVDVEIELTTHTVRSYIAACRSNAVGSAGTLPESLILFAADICIVKLNTRAGGVLIDDSGQRAKAAEHAYKVLREDVATCRFAIEHPDTGSISQSSRPNITNPDRLFSRDKQDGI